MELNCHDSVAVVAFPSGEKYPRLTLAALAEIRERLHEIEQAGLFEGVVIAANSRSFATGADIQEVAVVEGTSALDFSLGGQALFSRIEVFSLPVVAAIRGFCLGGGLDLALACHARVAAFDASFGHPGTSIGLITGWGGIGRLTRLIGRASATQLILTAERIPASQALTLGLVDELASSQDIVETAARRALAMGPRHSRRREK